MTALRRALRALGALAVTVILVFAAAVVLTARAGDPALFPARGEDAVTVHFVSHGYHSGLVLPRDALASEAGRSGRAALINVATRFRAYEAIEFGWGEEQFYREVPTASALTVGLALKALLRPGNASVLHVVGLPLPPYDAFPAAAIVPLRLSLAGFARLAAALEHSFARDAAGLPLDLGRGLYGPSLFYRAVGDFNLLNVCNHWTARLLDAAGVPTSPVLATLPAGLMLDLRLRSGLSAMPNG